ncbi:MAG: PAS domain S-box protein, partial [Candidatus Hermodarchaeota archaeon]
LDQNLRDSEERHRMLFEQSPDGVMILDPDSMQAIEYNKSLCRILGYTEEEFAELKLSDYEASEDKDEMIKHINIIKNKGFDDFETMFRTKNGDIRNIFVRVRTMILKDKTYFHSICRDITEQKIAGQKLEKEKNLYRDTINGLPGVFYLFNQKGEFQIWNKNFERLSGYTSEEFRHLRPTDFFDESEKQKISDKIQEIFSTHESDIEANLLSKNNILTPYYWYGKKIVIDDEEHIVGLGVDITDLKKAEQKLKESEENYRSLYEEAPNAYFSISIDQSILRCNNAAEKLLGFTKKELLKMRVFDLYAATENGLSKAKELFQKFSTGQLIQDEELQMKRKDGKHIWISLSVKPILNQEGNVIESRSMIIDIHERKRTEEALKSERDKLKAMIDGLTSAGLGIDIIGDDYTVQYMNDIMKEKFGDFIGKLCYKNYMGLKEPCKGCPVMKSIKTGTIERVEQSAVDNRNYEVFSAPIPNPDGTIGKAIELAIDITDRKKAEQELILLSQLKSELLTRYSHELKTPLMSIKGFTNLLSIKFQDTLHDEELSLVSEITNGCHRLETLVRDILNTADLDSGTVELEPTKSNLNSVIRSCVEELEGFIISRDHALNIKLHEKLLTFFDIKQIAQVVNNIMTNAIKFTPPQGTITIQSEIKEDCITISIRDTGIGFTKEETKRLFKRFGKMDKDLT